MFHPRSSAGERADINRVWDYIGFAVWFAGLGYIALWLTGPVGHLTLPPGLHALGVASAMFVPVRLVCRAVSRRRTAVQRCSRGAPALGGNRPAPAAPQVVLPAAHGQATQPVRPARQAGLNLAMAQGHRFSRYWPAFGGTRERAL